MPGVLRKATDSADTMRTITGDDFALQLLQKLMQPLSMLATNLFLICSSSLPVRPEEPIEYRDYRDCCHCCHCCCLLSLLLSAVTPAVRLLKGCMSGERGSGVGETSQNRHLMETYHIRK